MEIPNTYHFTAYYDVGGGVVKLYEQAANDKSLQDKQKNAFFDIHYKPMLPVEQMFAFRLTAVEGAVLPDDGPKTIAVNLRSGQFEVDGHVIWLHHELMDDCMPTKFRLIYYRNPAPFEILTTDPQTKEIMTQIGYSIGYVLGWQVTVKVHGKEQNIKRFIALGGVQVVV